ncbi:hypothetical protein BJ944DRAFT_227008 [Cunninghamella echinulata]|nr:hypothetical protein BJ944DRAFT_227008 [Cunninghamella echinulata]
MAVIIEMVYDKKKKVDMASLQHKDSVPNFTDFTLDPFKVSGSSHLLLPHQHREATRLFTLRLQPIANTQLATSLKQFQDQSYLKYGPNQGHHEPPHLKLLNKVPIDKSHDFKFKWKAVDDFIDMVNEEINNLKTNPVLQSHLNSLTFGGYTMKTKPTRSVSMRIAIPKLYSQLIYTLQSRLNKELDIKLDQPLPSYVSSNSSVANPSTLTSTSVERMLLAYNVLTSISEEDALSIKTMANDMINVNKWVNGKEISWEIVLYEILLESQVIGETTQMSIIKSWPLINNNDTMVMEKDDSQSNNNNALALIPYKNKNINQQQQQQQQPQRTGFFHSWIPTSLRVKLSVLSTRFR